MKNLKVSFILLLAAALLLAGCNTNNATSNSTATRESSVSKEQTGVITFTDSLGNEVTVDSANAVAVTSGSLADAWQLAGGTLAAVTEDAFDMEELTLNGEPVDLGSLKTPNTEIMVDSEIDFAILSGNLSDQITMRDTLEGAGITTAYFNVETFQDYASMMKILTDITQREDLYEENVTAIQGDIDAQLARTDGTAPTVLFLRAFSTGIKAKGSDSMTGAMLKELGCQNIADSDTSLLDNLSMEAILAADPDYIFVTTMGDEKGAAATIESTLTSNPAWNSLSAVSEDHYTVLPKELFQNKPNNRWAESYQMLADILYGDK